MKTYFLLLLLLTACQRKEKKPAKIIRNKVFLISYGEEKKPVVIKDTSYLESLFGHYDLVNLHGLDSSIQVQLRYADTANFLHRNFYDGLQKAYLPCEVAIAVCNAQYFLKQVKPSCSLLILDATRPLHIQQMMWDSLKLPANTKYNYLAPPFSISLHNYGCAVDVTIVDSSGTELDMGTTFDEFNKLSEPAYEWQHLRSGALSDEHIYNRKLLRFVMKRAGLNSITSEWWHFNYCTKAEAAEKFELVK